MVASLLGCFFSFVTGFVQVCSEFLLSDIKQLCDRPKSSQCDHFTLKCNELSSRDASFVVFFFFNVCLAGRLGLSPCSIRFG